MDIFTHAIVGAATGALFGRPIAGAVVAVAPDLVLGFKRKLWPTLLYDLTHSPIIVSLLLFGTTVNYDPKLSACLILCYLTHIILDVVTHDTEWAPQLFAPFTDLRFGTNNNWEWFNRPWWGGFFLSLGWVITCAAAALL